MIEDLKNAFLKKFEDFEQFTIDVVYERRTGRLVTVYEKLLYVLSKLFSAIVQFRLLLYKNRILRNNYLGCLVVVVGNLTVGGTGKTPVVEKFARSLADRGRKVAILSRGYKSKKEPLWRVWWRLLTHGEPTPPKVVSDGENILLDSEHAGDEPYMLAKNLPGIVVVVDKNRVKAGFFAIKKFGVDTLILDDGFQYLRLKGQLNLLLIDKTNPFGNGNLLPRGVLREPIKHIKRASYVFITKSNGVKDPELEALVRSHKPETEIIVCAHKPQYLHEVNGKGRLELSSLEGLRIGAFSGIAVPESFEQFLRDYGAEVRYNQRFLDHHRFTVGELKEMFGKVKVAGLDMVVTTEKDAVRISSDFTPGIPFYYLRLEVEILSGVADFEEAVSRICFPKKKMRTTRMPFKTTSQRASNKDEQSGSSAARP